MAGAIYPDLKGRTVFITGGAMGIGEAFVEAFHGQGCKVAFVDLADDRAAALIKRLGGGI
jgi:NAD(P)-dependent dehydrogenase (short-subunit alcohol dehydrogenase family)